MSNPDLPVDLLGVVIASTIYLFFHYRLQIGNSLKGQLKVILALFIVRIKALEFLFLEADLSHD